MSTASDYQLQASDSILTHNTKLPQLLRDYVNSSTPLEIDALVASGDCFVTLATELDDITRLLESDAKVSRPQLEKVIRILLYLQRHYKITRKPSEHRQ